MRLSTIISILLLLVSFSKTAEAYLGPGLGGGTIGIIVGLIVSIFLSLFTIVWYPLKKFCSFLFKKNKKKEASLNQ
jgi:TM2 domain-containing membrane protein YozV